MFRRQPVAGFRVHDFWWGDVVHAIFVIAFLALLVLLAVSLAKSIRSAGRISSGSRRI